MRSEPTCKCPMSRNGGIDHRPNCAWTAWKRNDGSAAILEAQTFDFTEEGIFKDKGLQVHDLNITRLVVKDSLRLAMTMTMSSILINDIKKNGVLNPIIVTDLGNGYYEIMDGIERFRAAILLGMNSIPGIIK